MTVPDDIDHRLLFAKVGLVARLSDRVLVDVDCLDGTILRLTVNDVTEVGSTERTVKS